MRDPTHLFEGSISPKAMKVADLISLITQPPFLAVAAFILLNLQVSSVGEQLLFDAICVVCALVIPIGVIVYFGRKHGNKDLDVERI